MDLSPPVTSPDALTAPSSRRTFLRRSAVVGAAVWAVPAAQVVSMTGLTAASASGTPDPMVQLNLPGVANDGEPVVIQPGEGPATVVINPGQQDTGVIVNPGNGGTGLTVSPGNGGVTVTRPAGPPAGTPGGGSVPGVGQGGVSAGGTPPGTSHGGGLGQSKNK